MMGSRGRGFGARGRMNPGAPQRGGTKQQKGSIKNFPTKTITGRPITDSSPRRLQFAQVFGYEKTGLPLLKERVAIQRYIFDPNQFHNCVK